MTDPLTHFRTSSPLTGNDDEWEHVYNGVFQNKVCPAVFKQADLFEGKAYWIEGKVFWEWLLDHDADNEDEDGFPIAEIIKLYYTNKNSFVVIDFPWLQPEKPEYIFVPTEEFPNEELS